MRVRRRGYSTNATLRLSFKFFVFVGYACSVMERPQIGDALFLTNRVRPVRWTEEVDENIVGSCSGRTLAMVGLIHDPCDCLLEMAWRVEPRHVDRVLGKFAHAIACSVSPRVGASTVAYPWRPSYERPPARPRTSGGVVFVQCIVGRRTPDTSLHSNKTEVQGLWSVKAIAAS